MLDCEFVAESIRSMSESMKLAMLTVDIAMASGFVEQTQQDRRLHLPVDPSAENVGTASALRGTHLQPPLWLSLLGRPLDPLAP